jgi:hypothetical protein
VVDEGWLTADSRLGPGKLEYPRLGDESEDVSGSTVLERLGNSEIEDSFSDNGDVNSMSVELVEAIVDI